MELTNTQMRVLEFVAEGMDAPEIAATLCVSPRTVQQHFLNLSQLFGSCNRVKWLLAIGNWVPGEPDGLRGERVLTPALSQALREEPEPQYHGEKCVCCQCPCIRETMIGAMWTVPMCQTCNARLNIVRAEAEVRKEEYLENAKAADAKDRERRRQKDHRRTQKYHAEAGGG